MNSLSKPAETALRILVASDKCVSFKAPYFIALGLAELLARLGSKKAASKARQSAGRARMLVNIFKNRDDLFYAGLEPGNVNNNSAFIPMN